jgi:LmbE family N-acetylglucosaminyl deacetylase
MPLDILALAAHRDDVEQTCGGTLLKMAERGYRTGILDLTQGEMGTRGTAEDRAREAAEAARILKVSWRHALDIPDGRVENTWENRLKVVRVLREQRPRVLILPYWEGRHPDHYTASVLGYEAAFLAGLAKLAVSHQSSAISLELSAAGSQFSASNDRDAVASPQSTTFAKSSPKEAKRDSPGRKSGVSAASDRVPQGRHLEGLAPHRPFKIIYASLYRDVRPTFVVDITGQFETRLQAIMAYKSQFTDQQAGSNIFPAQKEIRARVESMARFYGMQAGVTYAEPFVQKEMGLVDDLLAIPVKSI